MVDDQVERNGAIATCGIGAHLGISTRCVVGRPIEAKAPASRLVKRAACRLVNDQVERNGAIATCGIGANLGISAARRVSRTVERKAGAACLRDGGGGRRTGRTCKLD